MNDFQLWLANRDPADNYQDLLDFLHFRYRSVHDQWHRYQQQTWQSEQDRLAFGNADEQPDTTSDPSLVYRPRHSAPPG